MRIHASWLAAAIAILGTTAARAEESTRVVCRAVWFDEKDDESRNAPDPPRPVILMVEGRLRPIVIPKKADTEDDDGSIVHEVELTVERRLYGSVCPNVIRLRYGFFWSKGEELRGIFALVRGNSKRGEGAYSTDRYFFHARICPPEDAAGGEALATARLDVLTATASAIFLGTPTASAPDKVKIERTLFGSPGKAGEVISIRGQESLPYSPRGDGPFVYFLGRSREADDDFTDPFSIGDDDEPPVRKVRESPEPTLIGLWAARDEGRIRESVARRDKHPVSKDHDGAPIRVVHFHGSRAEALALLGSKVKTVRFLARERLAHDNAVAELAAAIRERIFATKTNAPNVFGGQREAVQLLSQLEKQATDGEIRKLIDEMLTRVERGADFPFGEHLHDEVNARRAFYEGPLDDRLNHSLAWLILSLSPDDATRIYGRRLLRLQDLTAYGWKEEARRILDLAHIEDRLEVEAVRERTRAVRPARVQVGFGGAEDRHYQLQFLADGKQIALMDDGAAVWNTRDGSLAGRISEGSGNVRFFSRDGKTVLSSGKSSIYLRDAKTGAVTRELAWPYAWPEIMVTTADDKQLIVHGGEYGKPADTTVFDLAGGKPIIHQSGPRWYGIVPIPNAEHFFAKDNGRDWRRVDLELKDSARLPFEAADLLCASDGGMWTVESRPRTDADGPKERKAADPREPFGPPTLRGDDDMVWRLRRRDGRPPYAIQRDLAAGDDSPQVKISADGKVLCVAGGEKICIRSAADGAELGSWRLPAQAVSRDLHDTKIVLSPRGDLLAVSVNYSVPRLFESRTGKRVAIGAGHSGNIRSLSFGEGDAFVETKCDDGFVGRWDPTSGERREFSVSKTEEKESDEYFDRFRPPPTVTDENGRLWRFTGVDGYAHYGAPASYEVRIYPQGTTAKEFADQDEYEKVKPLATVPAAKNGRSFFGLVPGGKFFYVGARIYRRTNGEPVSAADPDGDYQNLLFSADGGHMLVQTQERQRGVETPSRVRVYETATGKLLYVTDDAPRIRQLAFASKGDRFAVLTDQQVLCLWRLP